MNKADFAALFNKWKVYFKFNPLLKELNIVQPHFSAFCNGYYHSLSIEDCYKIYFAVLDKVRKIA